MQFNDALQRLGQLRAQLDDLRINSQLDPACLSKTLFDASFELHAIERLLEEKSGAESLKIPYSDPFLITSLQKQNDSSRESIPEKMPITQDFLEKIINSIGDPIFVSDRKHRYLFVNAAKYSFTNLKPEDIIGKTCYDFFPKEQAGIFWEKDEEVFATGRENVNEESVRDGQGNVRTLITKKAVYKDWAGNEFLVGISRDITERKKIEDQLKSAHDELEKRVCERTAELENANQALTHTRDYLDKIINSIGDPIHVKDRQHRVILVNDAACKLFGLSRDEILGRTAYELFPSREMAEISWHKDEEVFATGEENVNEETNTYAPGVTRTVLVKKTLYKDKAGNDFLVGVTRDITNRKRAEEALRVSEEGYRQLSEDMPAFVSAFLPDGTVTYLNKPLAAWDDLDPAEMIGRNFYDFLSPADRVMVKAILGALTPKQPLETHVQRYLMPDGRVLYHEWTNRAFFNEAGQPTRYQAIGLDITERKRAEEALLESEKKYSLLINNANESILVAQDGLVKFVNPATLGLLGMHSQQELIDKPFPQFIHPDDRSIVVENYRRRIANEAAPPRYAFRAVTLEGIVKWVEINATLIEWQGRPATLNFLTDITERKRTEEALLESEERLMDIIDFLPDATFVIDRDGKVLAWNRAIEAMTGVLAEDMIGKGDYEYALPFYGTRRPILIDLVLKADREAESKYDHIEKKGRALMGEAYMPNIWGRIVYLVGSATVLYDSRGDVFGAIESIRDITESKQAEDRLIEAKEAAEAAVRSKSEFLANMSHEIRTPLNAVVGLTGLLLEADLTAQERDYVETVRSSGNSLLSVINDILDFSKIEGDKMELESQPFNLQECIFVAVDLVKAEAEKKGLAIKYCLDEAIPAYFKGDVTRLRQVLVNLLSNAVKFTHTGTIEISVTAKPIQTTNSRQYELHFSIIDTGIGIPEEKADRLFQSFSQIDSTITRKYGGTGLGLAISRRLVELMGGEIWVVSQPGLGSTFHFTIIAEEAEEISIPVDSCAKKAKTDASRKNARPLRILLAEDNAVNQKVAIQMLKRLGYSADVAGNGLEVLQAIERQPYDIVLMDVQMPEMDGLVATKEIRKLWPKGPRIIAITAYALKGDRERCLAAGMDDYISKPIVIEDLRRVLEMGD
jgi:PAS domain S-box-containing protein